MKTSLSFLFLLLSSAGNFVVRAADDSHDHDHEDGHSCACEAIEFGFKIDCEDTETMLAALQKLQTDKCASDCSSADCEKNYLIVQTHHDYCPEDGVPTQVEDGFHDYDETCTACNIARKPVENAPSCGTPNCEDGSGNDAYDALIEEGCLTDCSTPTCKENFHILRAVHDDCDHDSLSQAAEEGIHDLEESCAAQACNPESSLARDQLVCDDPDVMSAAASISAELVTAAVAMIAAAAI
eukprot:CAMPEP_0185726964 /NCGR_PEP_ID=MMETSP1171-20130828/2782_1 /TAXON_ID=374046 /ORGANISM="Helicotheca tamensis, Strain CCMP826" /LENGTH=239 /DNA_ID=CAMNT_0028395415 /DNA_START=747 /DNA_END=1466 /DNA_ORIENTATION=-